LIDLLGGPQSTADSLFHFNADVLPNAALAYSSAGLDKRSSDVHGNSWHD
jgi:hypothetical protein